LNFAIAALASSIAFQFELLAAPLRPAKVFGDRGHALDDPALDLDGVVAEPVTSIS
jgi:hypothetical protein